MVKNWTVALLFFNIAVSISAEPYRWESAPNMPSPLQEIYPALWGNRLVVAGGLAEGEREKLSVSADVYQLEHESKSWSTLPALPEPRHHVMLVQQSDAIWAFGGFVESEKGQWTNTDTVMVLRTQSGKWEKRNPLPLKLSETVSAVLNGNIHLASGRTLKAEDNGRWSDHIDTDWHAFFDEKSGVWKRLAPVPTSRNSACSVVINDDWHVIGGRTVNGGNVDVHEVYNDKTKRWKKLAPMPEARGGIACATDTQYIYVFGGEYFDNGGGLYSDVLRYEVKRDRWKVVSSMPMATHGLGAVYWNSEIWIIGGAAQPGARKTKAAVVKFVP
ncbi:galactose oxidase [Alteromonas ponticola]|uniref:Galactose oxidase n=1 Tax=Alteromonas aquimaris TaxID=2998417 RepID=A0ABT3P729_9ALTE|nr:kelch repeat-containing protein [Alteromonas aquimaris]MCW8108576.1 galactose oxidase [Alteromonas aquimaris]